MNALPPSLVRFESELADAIRRHRSRGRRSLALRLAAVGAAATVVAFGALSLLPGDGPSSVERATAALTPSGATILHTVVLSTEVWPDGNVITSRTETWQQNSPPYDHRQVNGGGRQRELAMADGRPEYYDARTHTIYTVVPGTKLPPVRGPLGWEDRLIDNLRDFLRSGRAREDGRVTVDGRAAIRIVFSGWPTTLLVDAESGRPIESRSVSDEGVRVTTRFRTYEVLPATAASMALLSLRRQHPGAAVKPGITVEGWADPGKK